MCFFAICVSHQGSGFALFYCGALDPCRGRGKSEQGQHRERQAASPGACTGLSRHTRPNHTVRGTDQVRTTAHTRPRKPCGGTDFSTRRHCCRFPLAWARDLTAVPPPGDEITTIQSARKSRKRYSIWIRNRGTTYLRRIQYLPFFHATSPRRYVWLDLYVVVKTSPPVARDLFEQYLFHTSNVLLYELHGNWLFTLTEFCPPFTSLAFAAAVCAERPVRGAWRMMPGAWCWWYRREMVNGESKASLRSAVADGLLEYRRTCGVADTDGVEVGWLVVCSHPGFFMVLGTFRACVCVGGG